MIRKLGLLAAPLLTLLALAPAAHAASDGGTTIEVLSNRADLISAGDALVAIDVPAGADLSSVHVTANGQDVSDVFAATGGRPGSWASCPGSSSATTSWPRRPPTAARTP